MKMLNASVYVQDFKGQPALVFVKSWWTDVDLIGVGV